MMYQYHVISPYQTLYASVAIIDLHSSSSYSVESMIIFVDDCGYGWSCITNTFNQLGCFREHLLVIHGSKTVRIRRKATAAANNDSKEELLLHCEKKSISRSLKLKYITSTPYNHNNQNINPPANRHAREIVNQYRCKVRNLDVLFAVCSCRCGRWIQHVIRPFENTISQFHGKTVIVLCFGAFGEVNEDLPLDKVIQCLMFNVSFLARETASTQETRRTHNLTTCQHR